MARANVKNFLWGALFWALFWRIPEKRLGRGRSSRLGKAGTLHKRKEASPFSTSDDLNFRKGFCLKDYSLFTSYFFAIRFSLFTIYCLILSLFTFNFSRFTVHSIRLILAKASSIMCGSGRNVVLKYTPSSCRPNPEPGTKTTPSFNAARTNCTSFFHFVVSIFINA